MACITLPDEGRRIEDPQEIARFLATFGIWHERWNVEGRIDAVNATSEEILSAYGPEIERLKASGGYVTADVINVTAETPNLQAMLDRFNKEHTHTEDEVRFIVKGRGIFHIRPKNGPVFALQLDPGDLINVPAGTQHWFDLCEDRCIRAIRLFLDQSGWTPHYIENGIHANYTPVCWGPAYIPAGAKVEPAVKV